MFHGLVSFENLKQNCCVMVGGFYLFSSVFCKLFWGNEKCVTCFMVASSVHFQELSEAYLEPFQTLKVDLLVKTVNGRKP